MALPDILDRLTDADGDPVFGSLSDWPRWLPSALAWLLAGLALLALLVTTVAPVPA